MSKRKKSAPGQTDPSATVPGGFLRRPVAPWLAGLGLLVLLMFGDVLFTSSPLLLSQPGTDISTNEVAVKPFGFAQLKTGKIAMWNPHLWSGTAYFAGFDTGLLFPANAFFLFLPFEKAMNWAIALQTWLLGAGLFLLARQRGLHPMAGFLAGATMMFSGVYFLHIYSGHPNNISAMAVAPYIYLAAGMIAGGRRLRGWLVGSAALALQLLACQPQYVYYTCLGVLVYSLLGLGAAKGRTAYLVTLGLMVAAAVAMAAIQLLPAMAYISESLRSSSKGIPYEFAAMFSFPPENLITLVAPGFFGDMARVPYWGRCYLWEMCLFLSVTALVLAIYGACRGTPWVRRVALPMIVVFFVLALGAHTPLFRFLYEHAPGFNTFRGNSKFTFQLAIFLALAAAAGLDAILRAERPSKPLPWILGGAALLFFLAGGWASAQSGDGPSGTWGALARAIWETKETYLPPNVPNDGTFLHQAAKFSGRTLIIAAATLMLLAALAHFLRTNTRRMAAAFCVVAVVEIFAFARHLRPAFDLPQHLAKTGVASLKQFLAEKPGDYRILLLGDPNAAMTAGGENIWGYGSTPLKRYVEFMGFTQGVDPDTANQYVPFRSLHPLYAMLRCQYAFVPGENGMRVVETPGAMPRVHLVGETKVVASRDEIFKAMNDGFFDPRQTAILESAPDPAPASAAKPGTAEVTASGPDWIEIAAQVESPALLLVTDVYVGGWRARALPGSSQDKYDVMPANYILRGVPLSAGNHRIRMEYVQPGFGTGMWTSLAGWLAWGGVAFAARKRRTTDRL